MRRPLVVFVSLVGLVLIGLSVATLRHADPAEPTRSVAPVEPGPATLVGRVVDVEGHALPNVEVLAANQTPDFDWPLDAPACAESKRIVQSVTTDANGRFRIDGLESGLAQVSIRAKDFALSDVRNLRLMPRTETDLGDVKLQLGTRVRGRLVTNSGFAVSNASLFFLRPETSLPHAHAWTGVPVGSTNSRGEFEISHLEPGAFTLAVQAEGRAPFRFHDFVEDELELGDIAMPDASSISGIVLDFPQGELSDLRVVALPTSAVQFATRPHGQRGQPARWLAGYATARIGEQAGFEFTGLLPNTYYSLRVLSPGDELRTKDAWSPPRLVLSGTTDVVLTVHPSVRMDYEVVDAKTGDRVSNFERTWVGARNLPRRGIDYLRATTTNRRVTLKVDAPGYEPYSSNPLALVEANPLAPLRVELVPAGTNREVEAHEPEAIPAPRVSCIHSLPGFELASPELTRIEGSGGTETLTGRISENGAALVGAIVKLFPLREREAFFEARDDAIQVARTDREGRFVLRHVAAGEHCLSVEHVSRAQLALRTVDTQSSQLDIELGNRTLRGRVVTATGDSVADAEIHLPSHWKREARFATADGDGDRSVVAWEETESPPRVALTDADGRFEIVGLEGEGVLTLGARSKRFGVGTLRLASLNEEATVLLSSNSTLLVDGYDPKPLERALGVAWRWGRDYAHEIRFAFAPPLEREFRGLSADEWTVFQAELDGWGEVSSLRVLAPSLLSPVGKSHVQLRR